MKIPENYLSEPNKFKIEKSLLEKNLDQLQNEILRNIERSGMIETEVQRILNNSSLIFNYVENNLSLESKVNFFLERIKQFKKGKENLKKYFFRNTNELILKENKKKNLCRVKNLLFNLKELMGVMNILSDGKNSEKNLNNEKEIINKGKSLINKLKREEKLGDNFNLINFMEKELISYSDKSSKKFVEEFSKIFVFIFVNLINFVKKDQESDFKDEEGLDLIKFIENYEDPKHIEYYVRKLKIINIAFKI
jgi:hypothetical protein